MTIGPTKRYPTGQITPHGGYHLLHNRIPNIALRAYDDTVVFNLMGGLAIPNRMEPERVELRNMKGLVPPWKIIDQKGASEDGITFVDALYDPIEVTVDVRAVGRDPAHLRRVVSDLVASIDTKQQSELSWFTHEMGRWWAKVRWFTTPEDQLAPIATNIQELSLKLRADTGFWESYPHVDQFRFGYADDFDEFSYMTAPGDPMTGWTTAYSGGNGYVYTNNTEAISSLASGRTAVLRRNNFTAASDNQVVEIVVGTNGQWNYPSSTYLDLWIRMNNTGTVGRDGIRCRLGDSSVTVSSFDNSAETVIRDIPWLYGPQPNERFRFISGANEDSRTYSLLRNYSPVFTITESGTSSIGSLYRKTGFGMAATSTIRPLGILSWSTGDNSTTTQQGFLNRINVGDQPMWDRYLCIGPGLFSFGNGPNSTEMVTFGPLLKNQIMQIRTDPRKRGVVDMTVIPPTPQEVSWFQQALADFFTFITFSQGTAFAVMLRSMFGIQPPQGNPYSLLKGRFSVPIPPKSPGDPVRPYHIKCSIDDGSADSQIIAAGTPYRRLPF